MLTLFSVVVRTQKTWTICHYYYCYCHCLTLKVTINFRSQSDNVISKSCFLPGSQLVAASVSRLWETISEQKKTNERNFVRMPFFGVSHIKKASVHARRSSEQAITYRKYVHAWSYVRVIKLFITHVSSIFLCVICQYGKCVLGFMK